MAQMQHEVLIGIGIKRYMIPLTKDALVSGARPTCLMRESDRPVFRDGGVRSILQEAAFGCAIRFEFVYSYM